MARPQPAPVRELDHHVLEKYETVWFGISVVMVLLLFVGVLASMITGTFPLLSDKGGTHSMATQSGRIDPTNLAATPFATPGLVQTERGKEVFIVAKAFTFDPAVVRVPAGEPIVIHVTSPDVVHGFQVTGTNINAEILPGHVASFTVTFGRAGEQHAICNEYCGAGHHNMITRFIVEAPSGAEQSSSAPAESARRTE